MSEEDIESNIDWGQTKGFSKNTRISRRLDLKKAMAADVASKNDFKKTPKNIKKIAPNLKKIQSKIRDIYDDEDEDEDGKTTVVFDFNFDDMSSSLYTALSDEERTRINATKDVENQKMQQTAGKVAGIMAANKASKELGIKEMSKKLVANKTQDVTFDGKTFEQSLLENISERTKLKTDNLTHKESSDMIRGLVKLKQAGIIDQEKTLDKISESMESKDIVAVGKEKNNAKTAKMIMEKSGRKEEKEKDKISQREKQEKIKKIERSLNKVKSR